jgi:hypothetical protein
MGVQVVMVPDVRGMTPSQAANALVAAGVIGPSEAILAPQTDHDADIALGLAIYTSPIAGRIVNPVEPITIFLNPDIPPVPDPDHGGSISVIEPIFSANRLDNAAEATLRNWMPTYIKDLCLQNGIAHSLDDPNHLVPPRSYNVRNDQARWPEEQMPAVVVVNTGMARPPRMYGDGRYSGFWRVTVLTYCHGIDKTTTNRNNQIYAAAVRAILLQKRTLGGVAAGVEWEAEDYNEATTDPQGTRTMASSAITMVFEVENIINREGGPRETVPPTPDTIPGSVWGRVLTTFLHLFRRMPGEPLDS